MSTKSATQPNRDGPRHEIVEELITERRNPIWPCVVDRQSVLPHSVICQGLKSTTALKADHSVFLNGLPKVGTVIGKLIG